MVLLRGERVLLRPGHPEDADRLFLIRTEPEVTRRWGSADIEKEIREEFIGTDEGFVIEVDGEVVGAIQYHEENEPMYRHAGVNIFLTTSRHGEGLGTEAVRVLAPHLFQEHGHHRLTIDPAADNAAAIRAYEKAGFRKVGIMRKYERGPDGVWHDGLLMDLLKEPTFRTPLYLVQELTMCHPPSHERYTELHKSETLEHLGLVAGMFDELGIGELVDELVPQDLSQRNVSVGQALKAMVLNGLWASPTDACT